MSVAVGLLGMSSTDSGALAVSELLYSNSAISFAARAAPSVSTGR